MKKIFRPILLILISILVCALLTACFDFSENGVFGENMRNDAKEQAQEIANDVMGIVNGMTPNINSGSDSQTSDDSSDYVWYSVVRVIDGDTFVASIDGNDTKVRLIGVDTPESVATGKNAYKNCEEGKIASDFTKSLIENGRVRLELDVGPTDTYGRTLAYVYLEDGRMLNKVLLETGYARLMTVQPNVKYVDEFTEIQKQARENGKGFWDGCDQWN